MTSQSRLHAPVSPLNVFPVIGPLPLEMRSLLARQSNPSITPMANGPTRSLSALAERFSLALHLHSDGGALGRRHAADASGLFWPSNEGTGERE